MSSTKYSIPTYMYVCKHFYKKSSEKLKKFFRTIYKKGGITYSLTKYSKLS